MHGLINRGLQSFVLRIYGEEIWEDICAEASIAYSNFETMLYYDDIVTEQVLDAICNATKRPRSAILEDFGTFTVSEHCSPAVVKLLRLGGETFEEFLTSLEELSDRVQIAIPDMEAPIMRLEQKSDRNFIIHYQFYKCGYGTVFLGLIRAMADHYRTLITIEHRTNCVSDIDQDTFVIEVLERDWFFIDHQAA